MVLVKKCYYVVKKSQNDQGHELILVVLHDQGGGYQQKVTYDVSCIYHLFTDLHNIFLAFIFLLVYCLLYQIF